MIHSLEFTDDDLFVPKTKEDIQVKTARAYVHNINDIGITTIWLGGIQSALSHHAMIE